MSDILLPPAACRVLEALATYHYLTGRQLVALDVSKSVKSLKNNILPRLTRPRCPLIHIHEFGIPDPRMGRLPRIFCLTDRGAQTTADLLGCAPSEIAYPKGGVKFTHDYFHRVGFIDLHIRFRQWAEQVGAPVSFFTSYFEKTGAQRSTFRSQSVNRVELPPDPNSWNFIVPDCLCRFQHGGQDRLCAIELHRGTHSQRIIEQLERHLVALQEGVISEKFDHPFANAVLSVHETEATFLAAQKWFAERPNQFLPAFAFTTLAAIEQDFAGGWVRANGQPSGIFECP